QREKVRRIGVLITLTARDSEARAWVSALKKGLQKLGWEQDRNIIPTAYGLSPPNWWNWHLTGSFAGARRPRRCCSELRPECRSCLWRWPTLLGAILVRLWRVGARTSPASPISSIQ